MTSEHRTLIGTETEFGIMPAAPTGAPFNPIQLSADLVESYGETLAHPPVRWDYTGEDPLNDARGYRLERAHAHPSLLTDDPYRLAPSGGVEIGAATSEYDRRVQRATSVVTPNGARFYVDHAHPEYSAPETRNARDAVLWDRAGEVIARQAMRAAADRGHDIAAYKNNTAGKGAAYGTHENYLVARRVDIDDLARYLTPFLVTRPILCGSGRVGIGQRSEHPGFQISQRADFIENDIGLETTFNRPIINTRDEPHAPSSQWRRLHIINGDANQFDVSMLLRVGTTALVVRAIERASVTGFAMDWDALTLAEDAVLAAHRVSHDLTLSTTYDTSGGRSLTAIEIQREYLRMVTETLLDLDEGEREVVALWTRILDGLDHIRLTGTGYDAIATDVEWVAKYQLLDRQRRRLGVDWSDPRLAAMDVQWADLREERGLVAALDRAGRVRRLFSADEVERAAHTPPATTRAWVRGRAVLAMATLAKASWTSIVIDDPAHERSLRIPLPDPYDAGDPALVAAIDTGDVDAVARLFTAEPTP